VVPSLASSHTTGVYIPRDFFLHAASLGQGCPHCPIFPTAASRRSLDRISVPVWPVALSGRLAVFALVGRYPTNQLIARESLRKRIAPFHLSAYGVLAVVSNCCPPLPDRSSRVTHPSATNIRLQQASTKCPSDLHVLGTPPAFVLSQDQTLQSFPAARSSASADRASPSRFTIKRLLPYGSTTPRSPFPSFSLLPSNLSRCCYLAALPERAGEILPASTTHVNPLFPLFYS